MSKFVEECQVKVSECCPTPDSGRSELTINWSLVNKGLEAADSAVQKAKPILDTLLPDQYELLVNAVAAALHAVNTAVNPAPVTPPATS